MFKLFLNIKIFLAAFCCCLAHQNVFGINRPSFRSAPTPPPDPKWLQDLKAFIKHTMQTHSNERLDDYITPMVHYHEKFNRIVIENINVDQSGKKITFFNNDI
ncbi:hypothetical protein evm_013566 [Chilo suppressalis]|nr:hypothetical protein evm_013566 [Chilo suppressalis]